MERGYVRVLKLSDIRKRRYGAVIPPWANEAHMRALYRFAETFGYHVDHIVPVNSELVCGLHCPDNLQYLKPGQNIKKSNRWWPDMWLEQEELFENDDTLLQTRLTQL